MLGLCLYYCQPFWKNLTVTDQKRNKKKKFVKSHDLVQRVWNKSQDLPKWVHLPHDPPAVLCIAATCLVGLRFSPN